MTCGISLQPNSCETCANGAPGPASVSHQFKVEATAAARGMSDVDRILQVEMLGHSQCVGRVMVHVVARAHLRGATVTAPVMRDNAIAVGKGKKASACPSRPTTEASRGET